MLGILLALAAALFWGSGDFSGGFATRRINPFQVLALSAIAGMVVLSTAALINMEQLPSTASTLWSLLAGLSGAIGISALYSALSRGNATAVAPISAVIGAALPVGFTFLTHGTPAVLQLVGFALAFIGIWLVSMSTSENTNKKNSGIGLAFLAGAGFGGYFIFIGQVDSSGVFFPLLFARGLMLVVAVAFLLTKRLQFPSIRKNPMALLAGLLDSAGNVFFLLAKNLTRLDYAVIVSSLYPAVTVILTAVVFKEKVGNWQKAGVVLCLAAITLISL
jgi:drug/metabolite transporter (DMT)-like permease